jgi:nucleotide-binding universal stress UspA family protein
MVLGWEVAMYTILVAMDGSEHSLRAARYAAQRAREMPCRIELLHVEKPVMAWEVGPVSSIDAVADLRESDSKQVLDAGARQFAQATEVERHTRTGEPAASILDESERLRADEIIIGSRGLRPLGAALLGSVAYRVLHDARIPVVVVR